MGNSQTVQTKLHWSAVDRNWNDVSLRLSKPKGIAEAHIKNSYGDLPLHLACYTGTAPPEIIRALLEACPGTSRVRNKYGRDPIEIAVLNYSRTRNAQLRAEVLAILMLHGSAEAQIVSTTINDTFLPSFVQEPPAHLYRASGNCVVCMERVADIAVLPCGHTCLCEECAVMVLRKGLCPIARCKVTDLYRLPLSGDGDDATATSTSTSNATDNGGLKCATVLPCISIGHRCQEVDASVRAANQVDSCGIQA